LIVHPTAPALEKEAFMFPNLRSVGISVAVVLLLAPVSSVWAQSPEASVTDLTQTESGLIESSDLIEALAVPRGTRIRPSAPPTVRLPLYFEFNSVELRPDGVELLDRLSVALNSPDLEGFSFGVEGHTDDLGSESHNDWLSNERANTVEAMLTARGVDRSRLRSVGHGELKPVAPNDLAEGRQRNRRVEIINLGTPTNP